VRGPDQEYCAFSFLSVLTNYVVTNAAGGLNQEYNVGDIVMLKDVSFPPLVSA